MEVGRELEKNGHLTPTVYICFGMPNVELCLYMYFARQLIYVWVLEGSTRRTFHILRQEKHTVLMIDAFGFLFMRIILLVGRNILSEAYVVTFSILKLRNAIRSSVDDM